ncbi:MAG: imidazole glycerol phosphate synthase subunit HisH [Spirochaetes bacterium]|nr:imidazole glycerol phosphate synthase subunit HisH [Spirochaetota bacterium]
MITIIDLGISNIKSIYRGFSVQGFDVRVVTGPDGLKGAESLVLPGVGAFPRAMEILENRGLIEPILNHIDSGRPLLGVCLGMQLLFSDSVEHGLTRGLGIIPGHVVLFPPGRQVPHMGWNGVFQSQKSPIFSGIPEGADFYFVHSYVARPEQRGDVVSETDHGGKFVSAVGRKNVFGVQFHPEKSQRPGLHLLRNFAAM